MSNAPLHLLKLCVGTDTVEDLRVWQDRRSNERRKAGLDPRPQHVTRMWPRRSDEILDGGSLYWVFKGVILARQNIEDLEKVTGDDGISRCAIIMNPHLVRVEARPRRPFQGWRYLSADDAPPDLTEDPAEQGLPADLAVALDGLGVVKRAASRG